MKHETVFKQARKLIDERELNEENLDSAFDLLEAITEEDPKCGWAFGLISEIYYWTGEYADADDKLFNFEQGVDYGKKGVEADEDSLEANFWLAVNYGNYGQEKGIMKSLELINPIKLHCERAIKFDEAYFYGGPYRVLGRLYNKAPGFPFSIGDNKKALECLEKAVEIGPKFYLNRLFLADAYLSARNKEKARDHLEWVINAPLNKNHEKEDAEYKKDAEKLLKSI